MKKSKPQKTTAWILLGTGLAIAATGAIVQLTHENQRNGGFDLDFTGGGIAIVGGVVALSSIPFFIGSSKNKKKAASFAISNQKTFYPQQNNFALKKQPAITLKIGL